MIFFYYTRIIISHASKSCAVQKEGSEVLTKWGPLVEETDKLVVIESEKQNGMKTQNCS